MDFSNAYQMVENSVVNVMANSNNRWIPIGSGVLIGEGNRAITCAHCIINGAQMGVRFSGQTLVHHANIVFNDIINDVAVLSFLESIGNGVTLGNSSQVLIGQESFVVGFPMALNLITALSANIAGFENNNGIGLIRIDCAVNRGNSGGPLFNTTGDLIGIINLRLGSLSSFLRQIESANPQSSLTISGINPVQVLQQLIREMDSNLNLGIGYAIPINFISEIAQL